MIGWREKARAVRTGRDRQKVHWAAEAAPEKQLAVQLPQQAAFAKRVIHEVLIPVLTEFASIVMDTPAKPVYHEYDERTLGVTCDLDSLRFTTKVYLLPDSAVRIAVSLTPSQAEVHCMEYGLSAQNSEIEEWFGDCLARLYQSRYRLE